MVSLVHLLFAFALLLGCGQEQGTKHLTFPVITETSDKVEYRVVAAVLDRYYQLKGGVAPRMFRSKDTAALNAYFNMELDANDFLVLFYFPFAVDQEVTFSLLSSPNDDFLFTPDLLYLIPLGNLGNYKHKSVKVVNPKKDIPSELRGLLRRISVGYKDGKTFSGKLVGFPPALAQTPLWVRPYPGSGIRGMSVENGDFSFAKLFLGDGVQFEITPSEDFKEIADADVVPTLTAPQLLAAQTVVGELFIVSKEMLDGFYESLLVKPNPDRSAVLGKIMTSSGDGREGVAVSALGLKLTAVYFDEAMQPQQTQVRAVTSANGFFFIPNAPVMDELVLELRDGATIVTTATISTRAGWLSTVQLP